jgi:hypothetical protein
VNRYIAQVVAKLRNVVTSRETDADFEREIRTHLAFIEEEFLRRGMAPAEARRAAQLECGNLELTRQSHRDERAFLWLAQAGQDIQHALCSMRRSRGFTVAASVTSMVRNVRQEFAAVPGVESSAATFSAPYASRMGLPFTSVSSNSTVSGAANG